MTTVLYGATGQAGSRILKELLSRNHPVKAISRDRSKIHPTDLVTVESDDLSDAAATARAIANASAVISAYKPPDSNPEDLLRVIPLLVEAVQQVKKETGTSPRLLVVGGAATLEVSPGLTLLASGMVPKDWRPIAEAHSKAYALLKASDIDWTYFSPAGLFEPGERTGRFRTGTDQLIVTESGDSRISMEDFAIAMVDELEKAQYVRRRFTVGY